MSRSSHYEEDELYLNGYFFEYTGRSASGGRQAPRTRQPQQTQQGHETRQPRRRSRAHLDPPATQAFPISSSARTLPKFPAQRVFPVCPEFDRPWRPVDLSESQKNLLLRKLKEFRLTVDKVNFLRILLLGPIGAGKSSFINSVNTAIQGYNTVGALAASGSETSCTTKFKIHKLKKDQGSYYPFVFSDVMGLEPGSLQGVHTNDIITILKGHVKDGYTFDPEHPIKKTNRKYITWPSLEDKIHCLVSVLPADKISLMSDEVISKMKIIRERARHLDIPQVVIVSMVDKACPLVAQDLEKIYTSKKVKEKMQECSDKSGVPMNCIFPVMNYSEQVTNDFQMDILILMALTNIVMFANDYVEDQI